MKAMYWILGTAVLLMMLDHMTQQEGRGVCQPPQLSQVLR
jgi:hypothetical protein